MSMIILFFMNDYAWKSTNILQDLLTPQSGDFRDGKPRWLLILFRHRTRWAMASMELSLVKGQRCGMVCIYIYIYVYIYRASINHLFFRTFQILYT